LYRRSVERASRLLRSTSRAPHTCDFRKPVPVFGSAREASERLDDDQHDDDDHQQCGDLVDDPPVPCRFFVLVLGKFPHRAGEVASAALMIEKSWPNFSSAMRSFSTNSACFSSAANSVLTWASLISGLASICGTSRPIWSPVAVCSFKIATQSVNRRSPFCPGKSLLLPGKNLFCPRQHAQPRPDWSTRTRADAGLRKPVPALSSAPSRKGPVAHDHRRRNPDRPARAFSG